MTDIAHSSLLNEQQVGDLLGKSVATIRHWRRVSYGPAYVRVGRSPRYPASWVRDWLLDGAIKADV